MRQRCRPCRPDTHPPEGCCLVRASSMRRRSARMMTRSMRRCARRWPVGSLRMHPGHGGCCASTGSGMRCRGSIPLISRLGGGSTVAAASSCAETTWATGPSTARCSPVALRRNWRSRAHLRGRGLSLRSGGGCGWCAGGLHPEDRGSHLRVDSVDVHVHRRDAVILREDHRGRLGPRIDGRA